ncbi:amino acid ABC transporter permease [Verminephrobacter aporrectodeae]|uniref:amino acid ABC transporter permease n=1 Tax=Verminephrobacter aporrectodeae TaxID=1110389 RepID=UPI0002375035|nr:amino acid ABC transporter permease [Verminephrobacter aporrectodeae]MCW5220840.1 amino acid ABC transporter permease [Verminephrobacter aporrectodeae subsp. tuberculatae]MCW5255198.1 amino acid ABC transporter permease [Verminephrobacter aporrectodeae subsp. tuberculatae]MCW5290135.1 amino acid ABC transporter permease [Verminephrobacter aporrectodeae subsp. tuberculatae]MCW8164102.1 amino acid ABC transporter permease [Verminephrobacter aporrectodeae subsp. tuberculatae]MCW8168247.1 amino
MQFQLAYSELQWSDLQFVLQGLWRTILLTVLAGVFGTLLGGVIGWARESSAAARHLLAPYVDVTRSIPLIIQFILINSAFAAFGSALEPLEIGVLTLSLYMAVLTSELVRSGLRSVRPELKKASRSLGMSYWQELRLVSMPLAVRTVFPGWIGTLIGLAKDTALVSVVGYIELLRAAQILITRTNEALLLLTGVGVAYFLICYPISHYSLAVERRMEA